MEARMESILQVLMRRDGMTRDDAQELIDEAKERVAAGDDPEEVVQEEFGLEPDYFWDLL
jgi:predicted nucleic acid-binding protein